MEFEISEVGMAALLSVRQVVGKKSGPESAFCGHVLCSMHVSAKFKLMTADNYNHGCMHDIVIIIRIVYDQYI